MKKIFYGTILSYAKSELKNIDHLLSRAYGGILTEKSIDEAIHHLQKTQEHLNEAKKEYLNYSLYKQSSRSM